ncbi:MAG: hypothetical protein JXR95_10460 [Deltaproteobacteria bacterium]|nr:hypothetical protein [Deltaproteobacteria bacterium]
MFIIGCNADPDKLSRKPKRKNTVSKSAKHSIEVKPGKQGFLGNVSKDVKISLRPFDIDTSLKKRIQVGVMYIDGEVALRNLRYIELSKNKSNAGCEVDWILDVWTGATFKNLEIMWKCRKFRMEGIIYEMSTTTAKVISSMITRARLHPDRWLAILKVPVIHEPKTVESSLRVFVEKVIPLDYTLSRYPSFKVVTEHSFPLPGDLSTLDIKVKKLRNLLKNRLMAFQRSAKRRSGGIIRKFLDPVSENEVFSSELRAKWSMITVCSLGTNSDRVYWMSQFSRVWVKSINIPSHYRMMVIKKPKNDGPGFGARISSLDFDPPVEY